MTDTFDLVARLELGDGVLWARPWAGRPRQPWPRKVVGIERVDDRIVLDLVGPRGGPYTLWFERDEEPHGGYRQPDGEVYEGEVIDVAVVPAECMPDRPYEEGADEDQLDEMAA